MMDMTLRGIDAAVFEMPEAIATVRQLGDGYKAFQVMNAGFCSGLFDWLETNAPAEKSAISAALNLRGAHLGGFLQALEDLGLLAREGAAYKLAPGMDTVLTTSSPWSQAEVINDLAASSGGWSSLDRFLSNGWVVPQPPALPPMQHPFAGEAQRLANYLALRFKNISIRSILCFDGGDGLFAATAHRHFPDAQITVVVPPETQARVQQILSACEAQDRCQVIQGTALEPVPGSPVDLVVLFHALYPVRRATNDALAAVAARLAPGGELYCAHWFCLEACETAPGGLRDLEKAILTDSHPMCHVETFCERFGKINLVDAGRDDLIGEYGTTKVHFARRPYTSQEI